MASKQPPIVEIENPAASLIEAQPRMIDIPDACGRAVR